MTRGNTFSTMVKRRRFQSPRAGYFSEMKKTETPCKRPRVGRYDIAIADRHNGRNDLSMRDRLYYQVSSVTVPFRPGDRLQPVCLMSMSYNFFYLKFGGPLELGGLGPGRVIFFLSMLRAWAVLNCLI